MFSNIAQRITISVGHCCKQFVMRAVLSPTPRNCSIILELVFHLRLKALPVFADIGAVMKPTVQVLGIYHPG
jgi:hypothetical protein